MLNQAPATVNKVFYLADYTAYYSGNFISSLAALEEKLGQRNIAVSYVFPEGAPFANWGGTIASLKTVMCVPLLLIPGFWVLL